MSVPPGSSREFHHAITGTGAQNLAIAANIPGSVVHGAKKMWTPGSEVQIGHPSGKMGITALVDFNSKVGWRSLGVGFLRTARILFRGSVVC
jgi:2-methylaconitate cis-trans-isomerase PrpF